MRGQRTAENIEKAKAMDAQGMSRRAIGEVFGVTEGAIRCWLDPEQYAAKKARIAQWQRDNPDKLSAYQKERRKHFTREQLDRECAYQRRRYRDIPAVRERLRGLAAQYRRTAQGRLALKVRLMVLGYSNRFPLLFGPLMAAITGLTREQFAARLAGEGEIDHIVPVCAFDLTDPEHLVRCNHPSNIRLVSSQTNQRKGGKVPAGLDVMTLPWSGNPDALAQAESFISRQLARLDRLNAQRPLDVVPPAYPGITGPAAGAMPAAS
jgi:transposase